MNCDQVKPLLGALVDGELDFANAAAAQKHAAECADCGAELEALQALRSAVRRAEPYRAPESLRRRVAASVPRRRSFRWDWGFAFVAGVAATALCLFLLTGRVVGRNDLADGLVTAHLQSLLADHLLDVVSMDRHTVKPWFNGKVDTAPTPIDLASDGYPLLGGRVDFIEGKPTAVLVYGRNKHRINVFVLHPNPEAGALREDIRGFHVVGWNAGGLAYVAVSDLDPGELRRFAELMRARR